MEVGKAVPDGISQANAAGCDQHLQPASANKEDGNERNEKQEFCQLRARRLAEREEQEIIDEIVPAPQPKHFLHPKPSEDGWKGAGHAEDNRHWWKKPSKGKEPSWLNCLQRNREPDQAGEAGERDWNRLHQ